MPGQGGTHISRLDLTGFRNYRELTVAFAPGPVVLTGENGAGKTNLLEAISLLAPGRGLRRSPYAEMAAASSGQGFAVHAVVDGPLGRCEIGTGTIGVGPEGGDASRRIRINGAPARSAEEMLEWLRVVWLVPAMDQLFTGPASERRRFLDRLVLAIDPGHGRRAIDFEKAMRGRNRLLTEYRPDETWLHAIEAQMAETGIAIAAARAELVGLLSAMMERLPTEGPFPQADIAVEGSIDVMLRERAAYDVEQDYRRALGEARRRDAAAGRTLEGPHRSDLVVRHRPKDMPADRCSTGEQKALLTGIVLSHTRLVGEIGGISPVLLLDEIAAHLDAGRREALFGILDELGCQTFMTGTDAALFSALAGRAQFLTVSAGSVAASQAG